VTDFDREERRETRSSFKRGISAALKLAFDTPVPVVLLDAAADTDFEGMIERLRGEPFNKGGITT
jgi:hypothetical protein